MPQQPVRVLVVDDSITIRQLIRLRLAGDPRLVVVGEAADAFDAREKIKLLNPDVITLDVEMPGMSGLDFLERLMRLRPTPVIMVSSETHRGSHAALEALSLGAVDCIGKPINAHSAESFAQLPDLLCMAAQARLRQAGPRPDNPPPPSNFRWNGRVVLIGSSTGGVDALETVLSGFPADCPPTLITQHMPAGFLSSFAARLDQRIAPHLSLATDGARLEQGRVYLAPGGETHLAVLPGSAPSCRLVQSDKRSGHRPSVDVLFASAVPMASRVVAALLTGMGRDGADEMLSLRQAGARCLAQDEASCVVYGMPRAAVENGGAEQVVPLRGIAARILEAAGKGAAAPEAAIAAQPRRFPPGANVADDRSRHV
ncbi:chemotaxis response regulator protein-glutamate methylesterase [Paracoccus sp. p3-h83]|uniref:protein-glutamate methylesterase/protein-glutamine glutaminase n=1 Tax=Paracoccus sp. p3-h83 TaxID=3342805 RepID=UPI0035B89744